MAAGILFLGLVTAIVYILIGYPALLALLPRKAAPAVRKDLAFTPSVSVILAVHNGAAFLDKKLASILALDYPAGQMEVFVVSDGSTDQTEAIAESFRAQGVQLLRQPHRGKAAALNLAFTRVTGDILFFTDVRQLLDAGVLRQLAANFADPTIGAVTGEMKLHKPDGGEQADMDLYWRYELWVRTRQSDHDSLFNTTGCVYALRRALAAPLREETLSDDAMLPLGAFFRGHRVIFDSQAIVWDQPAVAGTEFRRRWRNLAGLWQVHAWRPELFTSANRMRWHFLSHKFSRLMLPWLLLAAMITTWFLPNPERTALGAVEVALLACAALDSLVPQGWPGKRLTSPLRTFLAMNLAAALAITVFFISPQKLWKPTTVAPK